MQEIDDCRVANTNPTDKGGILTRGHRGKQVIYKTFWTAFDQCAVPGIR